MMMFQVANPATDTLQGLIESQTLRIEMLRAQIHAFQALAETIEREPRRPAPIRQARPRRVIQNIPA
jgi:hypothetical protein